MAKEPSAPVSTATSSIASTALEKKMNEQMTKGSVVVDSAPVNSTVPDTSSLPTQIVHTPQILPTESVIQKSPPKANNTA